MKYVILFLAVVISLICCKPESTSISLFNGENFDGWHSDIPAMDTIPDAINPFIIRNRMLVSLGTPRGHLITDAVYKNYRLEVEYRFSAEPGNCGVILHVSTPRVYRKMFPQGIEAQLKHENAGDFWVIHEDITCDNMVERRGPKENWGSTIGKGRRIENLTDDSENEVGQWNTMTMETVDDNIKVWVNGDLVNYGYDATVSSGQIALQAEDSEVEFRKVELTPITSISK